MPVSGIAIEVTRPGKHRARPGIRAHRASLQSDEVTIEEAIPATSPFRTVLDLAGVLDRRGLENAVSELEHRGLTDRLSFDELFERHPGKRGATKLRAVLESDEPGGIGKSELEEAFIDFVDEQGLLRPERNAPLALGDRFIEIDAMWRRQRIAVELDSRTFHLTPAAFESDRERDRALVALGWRPIRVTWRHLHSGRAALAADLCSMLTL